MKKTPSKNLKATHDPEQGQEIVSNFDDPVVASCLELLRETVTDKMRRDKINEDVANFYDECASVEEPSGARLIESLKPVQLLFKTMGRIKSLDATFHGTGATESSERLVSAGMNTILNRSWFLSTLLCKGGVMQSAVAFGDGFWSFSTQEKGFPFKCFPIPVSNVYVDTQATGMRCGAKQVQKLVYIVQMSTGMFERTYPDFKGKVGFGQIPRNKFGLKDLDQKRVQNVGKEKKNFVEVAFFFDIANLATAVFAGTSCTLIKKTEGETTYPYKFKDEGTNNTEFYIPVFHFTSGHNSLQGFWNHGILHLAHKASIVSRRLFNKTALHVEDNADPVNFISVGQNQSEAVIQAIRDAQEVRAQGGKPIVPLERSLGDSGTVSSVSLQSQSNISEVQYLREQLDLELKRLGLHLDEPETSGTTATEILSEEENANMFVKLMMKNNAPEFEMFLKVVLAIIKDTVSKDDNTPLNAEVSLFVEDAETGEQTRIKPKDATLGLFVREITDKHYFPKVNAESGYIASKLKAAQIARGLSQAAPGTKAYEKLLGDYAAMNDLDLSGADFLPQQTAPQQNPSTQEVSGGTIPSETERMSINPRLQEQLPVI